MNRLDGGLRSRLVPSATPPLTGLAAWYRADLGVTEGTGGISAWADQSGNSEDLAQATEGNRPALVTGVVNGHPVVRFTRANVDYISRATTPALSQPYTWVVVAARTTDGADQWFVSMPTSYRGMVFNSSNQLVLFAGSTFNTGDTVDNAFHALIAVLNGASSEAFIDNVSAGSGDAGAGTLAGVMIGAGDAASYPFGGDVAETLLYDHALDAAERTALAAYFARYGI